MNARLPLFVFALLLGLGLFLGSTRLHSAPTPAPDWKLNDLNGKTVKLSDFKGKVIVINFWATWCPPCVAEIPEFIELQNEFHNKDVAILGLSVDSVQSSEVAAFAKKAGMNYPVLMSTDDVAAQYGADAAIPFTFVIDRTGNIVLSHLGIVTKSTIEDQIKKLLPAAH